MSYLTKPLTIDELKKLAGYGNTIKAVVPVSLGMLITGDIDDLNDLVDEKILPQSDDLLGWLSNISYRVVGHIEGDEEDMGSVLIEVTAEVDFYDEE